MENATLLGGVEAGGTKFVCAIGTADGELLARVSIPTTIPTEVIPKVLEFFRQYEPSSAIGIASFGPLVLNVDSPQYGTITSTPKLPWQGYPILASIRDGLGIPVGLDTDVNGAALAEGRWGAARGCETFVYVTVGTGIGGGGLIDGRRIHGLFHPEMGHMRVPRVEGAYIESVCPFHADCLEGLASGPAMARRTGITERAPHSRGASGVGYRSKVLGPWTNECCLRYISRETHPRRRGDESAKSLAKNLRAHAVTVSWICRGTPINSQRNRGLRSSAGTG